MAAAPKRSAPGPVKLCVGECRPELSVQSSQLYSFLVRNRFDKTSSVCVQLIRPNQYEDTRLNTNELIIIWSRLVICSLCAANERNGWGDFTP